MSAPGEHDLPPIEPDDGSLVEEGDHHVPADLIELHEVLAWQAAVEGDGDDDG
jgi:hypothetical protein